MRLILEPEDLMEAVKEWVSTSWGSYNIKEVSIQSVDDKPTAIVQLELIK